MKLRIMPNDDAYELPVAGFIGAKNIGQTRLTLTPSTFALIATRGFRQKQQDNDRYDEQWQYATQDQCSKGTKKGHTRRGGRWLIADRQ